MKTINAAQAAAQLDSLLEEVSLGKQVVIVRDDGSAFTLVALSRVPKPVFGSARGLVHMEDDFDDPIEGFEDYT
jgi:antitoxin (DNA-binding transcriptional repressor) of toxin-antitoxin stability system